ncbi:MAG: helicase [Alcanivorax sp.]|nr:helicase [Alcanivorax sp.]
MLDTIVSGEDLDKAMFLSLKELHEIGPRRHETMERLAYIKLFHPRFFEKFESKILTFMGLFYKKRNDNDLVSEIYELFQKSIILDTGKNFTPVQASVYKKIREEQYFSFSAPTSAGKSYLFRQLLLSIQGDVVIIVPSRALIAEYYQEVFSLGLERTWVSEFVDIVNLDFSDRRIFILTPERASEVLRVREKLNVTLFLMDEAQISEDPTRGIVFDALVRRLVKNFKESKYVFAHPFIDNPDAQLDKHSLYDRSSGRSYDYSASGKVYAYFDKGRFHFFSPFSDFRSDAIDRDIVADILINGGTALFYVSKSSIYKGEVFEKFSHYLKYTEIVKNKEALDIIDKLRAYIGANADDKVSNLIEMMKKGVVIHHGSIPLKARVMIESFVRKGFARICFATSTLNQGINMPFDCVWIESFLHMTPLTLKNLIGRSGRTGKKENEFSFGYTVINKRNLDSFSKRLKSAVDISCTSKLDADIEDIEEDYRDLVESIKNNSFNDALNIPEIQVDRIRESAIESDIAFILDSLFDGGRLISSKSYYQIKAARRNKLKVCIKNVFVSHMRRDKLTSGEASVLSAAVPILLWKIRGRSFNETVSLRHSYITRRDERRALLSEFRENVISATEYEEKLKKLRMKSTPVAHSIPDEKRKKMVPLFGAYSSYADFDFDLLVYDTYDYLDKVISLSIADPICAALEVYAINTDDSRARSLQNHIKYGTDNEIEIWLTRYGIDMEDIEWVVPHVEFVDERRITFKASLFDLPDYQIEILNELNLI